MTRTLTIGVLGGMGPQATVDFMQRMLLHTPATTDQDHIPLLIDHNTSIPDRHASIDGSGENAEPVLIAMASRLENAGADFLVMVCNTAHVYANAISNSVRIPFVNMISEVVDSIPASSKGRRIGVMAAQGCIDARLYQNALVSANYQVLIWDEQAQDDFMRLLYEIKAGKLGPEEQAQMLCLAMQLADAGADMIIAACTEIPLLLHASDLPVPLLNSTDVLVNNCIEYASGRRTLKARQNCA